ncbi:hypothetical protein KV102_16250 [Mumia sp. zg.B53]|uniref:hypothetical protein n=1 Tax=unclassified Mumia TaxID=2621872 RepID=UPI001C6E2E01|nr:MULTISPECIES: hypothetical protein [unclassified Mumia]MBW9205565.1 hypothetical protein [Mumia sp. zg.B17]MBW9208434.1 hypothetical protein [Mumia sp. zg.B21]MBW9216391.1 hypothetical protein [Mumia sp. zg.B53]MDD9349068.1 hypothetical protein [Mumia sp.]
MYAALWRILPGPTAVKALIAVALFVGVVLILFLVVFPEVEPLLPFDQITLEPEQTAGTVGGESGVGEP